MRRLNPPATRRRNGGTNAARRQRILRMWFRPIAVGVATFLFAGVLGAGGYWGYSSGFVGRTVREAEARFLAATADAGLAVEEVLVAGRHETTREQVMLAINVRRGDPLLGFEPDEARARLRKLGWIADATVERRYPDTVFVRLRERTAMAIWQRNKRFVLVDTNGEIIGRDGLERYGHLKVIVGADAPKHAADLLEIMRTAPDLMHRVTAAAWVGGRRWNLRFDDRIDIRLPEADPEAAWQWLAALQRDHALLARDITAVDLRIPDKLIVRVRSKADKRRADGDQT